MIDKYQIIIDDIVLGFKYNHTSGIAVLGGNCIFRKQAKAILKKAFENPRYQVVVYETRNIIRFHFRSRNVSRIDKGIAWLRENGFVVEPVKVLEFIRWIN